MPRCMIAGGDTLSTGWVRLKGGHGSLCCTFQQLFNPSYPVQNRNNISLCWVVYLPLLHASCSGSVCVTKIFLTKSFGGIDSLANTTHF